MEADKNRYEADALKLIREMNALTGAPGYFTQAFCEQARFFHPKNGERVDAMREFLEEKSLEPLLKSILLVSLMEGADRVDSTCGLQMS